MTKPFQDGDAVAIVRGDRVWDISIVSASPSGQVAAGSRSIRREFDATTGYEVGITAGLRNRLRIVPLTPELLAIYREQREIELDVQYRRRLVAEVQTWLLTASAEDANALEAFLHPEDDSAAEYAQWRRDATRF